MKVIVFGGAGFLGSHVCDALTDAGHDVIVFDSNSSSYLKKNQKMILGDILDQDAVEKAINGCDIVYNFAGVSDIGESHENPLKTVKINVLGNSIILESCRLNNIKRFIFASSLYVYSSRGTFYKSSKQASELLIESYKEVFGMPYTILRYGSIYGPRADKRNYIYNILKQAIQEKKITSFGDGEDVREYIHVLDAARCSVEILSEEFENEYVTISGAQSMKRKEMLSMIKEIFRNEIDIEFQPTDSNLHYKLTPYSFSPKIAKKFISKYYLDLGQGLLQCIEEIYNKQGQENKL